MQPGTSVSTDMTTSYQDLKLLSENGAPETIRTSDLALRRRLLYPAELPGQKSVNGGAEEDRTPDLVIANAKNGTCKLLIHNGKTSINY